ncbi:MAG: PAS domain S-box protein [Desulfatiglans sp.]|nr:PAS domain S-box protein [Desulfatiglans sp.]
MQEKIDSKKAEDEIKRLKEELKKLNTEKALLEEKYEFYRAIFDNAGVTINLVDPETLKFVEFNKNSYESLGYTRDEFMKLNIPDIVVSDSLGGPLEVPPEIFGNSTSYESRVKTKSGDNQDVLVITKYLKTKGKTFFNNVVTDITRLKETERALKKSEEFSFSILENSPSPIMVINKEFNIEYVNPAMVILTGYNAEELLGTTFPYPWVDEIFSVETWREATSKGVKNQEASFINKKGERFYVIFSTTPVYRNGEFQYSLSTALDITERKRAQEEEKNLRIKYERAQRMEALGTLAGGIAHDFNNLLMGIQGRTSLMLIEKSNHDQEYEHLMGIEEYVKSATSLTRQLLGFARGGKYEVKPLNLNELLSLSADMFGRMKKEISIHKSLEENLWTSEVDRGQVDQVLMNIFVNAWQAMPGGGNLYIESENIELKESFYKPYKVKSGRYVKISITDNGTGMDKATMEKIFDPFFTTKEMGRGTGLGLASVYGIMKNHGGFVDVYSEKGVGTIFKLYFPASEKEAVKEVPVSESIIKGSGKILLVDDEELVIDVGTRMLEKLGYIVLAAKNGKEAMQVYQENRDKIDMIILDMIMPGMNGGDVFEKLKEINPEIKVLLSSGYSINGQAVHILEKGCRGFIQKPFDLQKLSQKIREVLEGGGH